MIKQFGYIALVLVTFYACSPSTTTTTSSVEVYSEDLSIHRPKYVLPETKTDIQVSEEKTDVIYPEPQFDVTTQVNSVLDSIVKLRSDIKYVDGFTIQVYSGTNSDEAKLARGKVYSVLPESSPTLKYDEPNFKVKVGTFYSRLEAQKSYAQLKQKFSSAIIIPERINIE